MGTSDFECPRPAATCYRWWYKSDIQAAHAERLRLILGRLNVAQESCDMDFPGFDLHQLQPKSKKYWAVTLNKNWRITFKFTGKNVVDVDLLDYH